MLKEIWPSIDYRPVLFDEEDYEWAKNFVIRYLVEYQSLNRRFRNILGIKDGLVLDHINGDRNDFRRINLQGITPSENRKKANYEYPH